MGYPKKNRKNGIKTNWVSQSKNIAPTGLLIGGEKPLTKKSLPWGATPINTPQGGC